MAYPNYFPFKTKYLHATSTTSNTIISLAVPQRAKYITGFFATTPLQSQTAATNTCEVLVNGSVIVSSGTAVTTSTGNGSTQIPVTATSAIYLAQGDVLSTVLSSCVGGNMTYIVQEF